MFVYFASMEGDSSRVREKEVDDAEGIKDGNENNNNKKKRKQKKKKKRRSSSLVRFGCLRMESDENGGVDMEVEFPGERNDPTHLVIMVNGIIGSAQNWRYAAKQFLKKYPEDVIVHCSERNSSMLTFDGVNVMGDRLAEEVKYVISRHPSVQKISFVGHSLGGLVARYAIARLYAQDLTRELSQTNGDCGTDHLGDSCPENKFKGKIAGLEPINFITFASPHLGSRWHKQIPLLCGSHALEKVAARTSWLLGRTGKHLFLTDGKEGKPPLLLQMVSDCEDLKFMSALQSFRRRVAYANASFDHIVGWSTSSLRRRNELPKIKHLPRGDKYPHVVNVETAKTATLDEVPSEAKVNGQEKINMEEEMIRGLTKVSWERVDVYFKGSRQRLLAHSTIQVKNYWVNSDGADVVEHMIDNFLL
ncbi:Alpha/beta-Hydrolases superfamily protein, putative [Theobroma cacao]|uniref:Alpha/beta-Hydrolases superfamily protein, putative n=1 Tax=Theobroma cacao TaxID=3641 RepID=A0A061FM96_THECC|nr:Alpha/beta-Hydrolases superfamily protein, putative [Theobroma cacao]